jgi:hypothetical protein
MLAPNQKASLSTRVLPLAVFPTMMWRSRLKKPFSKRAFTKGVHYFDCHAITPPIIGCELNSQDGLSLISSRLTKAGASTQPLVVLFEDPHLKIPTWVIGLPSDKKIEELCRPLRIGTLETVEPLIAWVGLIRDEPRTVRFQKIA